MIFCVLLLLKNEELLNACNPPGVGFLQLLFPGNILAFSFLGIAFSRVWKLNY